MFRTVLRWLRLRKKQLLGISLLFSIVVFLLPIPISDDYLNSSEWCVSLNPFHRWRFNDDSSFENYHILIGEFDGVVYSDRGIWSRSGEMIEVAIENGELMNNTRFKIRVAGLGKLLWSYGDFLGEGDEGLVIALRCNVN